MARSVTEVGPGDWVKVNGRWERILTNSAHRQKLPRHWTITTVQGGTYGMWDIDLYAKEGDQR